MKKKFETNMYYLIKENLGDITMNIVVDSSSVINDLNRFAKGKSSLLFNLAKNPIFPLCAPPILENLNETYTRWYSILVEDPTKESRIDENFTPIVNQDGYDQ